MEVRQCDLSDPHYGFDLVVAVTQRSINTTLKQLLANLNEPEVTICYVYDLDNNIVPKDYKDLKTLAHGSDPFTVPDNADSATNQDLINLTAANFAGAVRAKLGLPDVTPANLPPIVTLQGGAEAPVIFNLLCSKFDIAGFQYGPRGKALWINKSQPTGTGSPWYFTSTVSLNRTRIDPNSKVPPLVQARINTLEQDAENAFTIQKLYLDLDTAILLTDPAIDGIPAGWTVWSLIESVFLTAYFDQLRQTGDPVLSYHFTVQAPKPTTLLLGAVSRECMAFIVDGTPTPQQIDCSTMVYLGSQTISAPVPVPFKWNWVEVNELTEISGVQAVRKDVFFNYFNGLLNTSIAPLSIDTNVSMTHSGEDFTISYSRQQSSAPAAFKLVTNLGSPENDGFITVSRVDYNHNSSDDSEDALHTCTISGDYNYTLQGSIAVKGNQIRVQIRSQVYMHFKHREVVATYTDFDGKNYYDKTKTFVYTMFVATDGTLKVTSVSSTDDQSANFDFDAKGILGTFHCVDSIRDGCQDAQNDIDDALDTDFGQYFAGVQDTINGYKGWVFPGNDAFTFKQITFSDFGDLTAQLTYVVV